MTPGTKLIFTAQKLNEAQKLMYFYRDHILNPIFGLQWPHLFTTSISSLETDNNSDFWVST